MPTHHDVAHALHKTTRRLGFFYRKTKTSHSRQQLAPVAEALRALQQRTFPTQADNLQSACAKAPSETRGLFGFLAALAGADRHGLSEATLATPALEKDAREEEPAGDSAGTSQQEPATLPLRKNTPEQKQKETQTELAASNETATQTEPATQAEDAQTDGEKEPTRERTEDKTETLQEELATNNAHADSKSAKKKKKKKAAKAPEELAEPARELCKKSWPLPAPKPKPRSRRTRRRRKTDDERARGEQPKRKALKLCSWQLARQARRRRRKQSGSSSRRSPSLTAATPTRTLNTTDSNAHFLSATTTVPTKTRWHFASATAATGVASCRTGCRGAGSLWTSTSTSGAIRPLTPSSPLTAKSAGLIGPNGLGQTCPDTRRGCLFEFTTAAPLSTLSLTAQLAGDDLRPFTIVSRKAAITRAGLTTCFLTAQLAGDRRLASIVSVRFDLSSDCRGTC